MQHPNPTSNHIAFVTRILSGRAFFLSLAFIAVPVEDTSAWQPLHRHPYGAVSGCDWYSWVQVVQSSEQGGSQVGLSYSLLRAVTKHLALPLTPNPHLVHLHAPFGLAPMWFLLAPIQAAISTLQNKLFKWSYFVDGNIDNDLQWFDLSPQWYARLLGLGLAGSPWQVCTFQIDVWLLYCPRMPTS